MTIPHVYIHCYKNKPLRTLFDFKANFMLLNKYFQHMLLNALVVQVCDATSAKLLLCSLAQKSYLFCVEILSK
jgi:hypothetical protein